ncbi:MAG: MlaD family protein, partial [Gemmatimonadaceae bacterium]
MKRRDEVSVGILITLAVVVLLAGVLWLARGGLSPGYPLYTRFAWGQNLKQGQPVLLAGVNIGSVDDVKLRPDGYLDIKLRIDNHYHVPRTAKATVLAVGFFGDVAVALTPERGGSLAQTFAVGDTIPAGPPEAGVAAIMSKADSISSALNTLIQAMQAQIVNAGTLRDLHATVAHTAALAAQLQQIAAQQNDNMTQTFAAYRKVADAIDTAQLDSTVRSFRASSRYVANTA